MSGCSGRHTYHAAFATPKAEARANPGLTWLEIKEFIVNLRFFLRRIVIFYFQKFVEEIFLTVLPN
jgi:hypothetical protein